MTIGKKIIVCDLDGTLLRRDKTISKETCEYLIQLQQQGHVLVLASGRFYPDMKVYMHQLRIPAFHGYVVCGNGLEVYQGTKRIHSFEAITLAQVHQLLQLVKHQPVGVHMQVCQDYYADFGWLMNLFGTMARCIAKCLPIHQFHMDSFRRVTFTNHMEQYMSKPIEKLGFISTPKKSARLKAKIHQMYPGQYHAYDLNTYGFELVTHTVGKHLAVAWLCERLQLAMQDVIAFGDSGNDVELLVQAGHGFVMKNGYDFVKQRVSAQTAYTNQEDGIKKTLETLL